MYYQHLRILAIVFLTSLTLNFLRTTHSQAAIIRVPEDHTKIQFAINTSIAGDTILVAAGIYPEHIYMKSGITLLGTGKSLETPADSTDDSIIDGTKSNRTVTFYSDSGSTISGFTITNGQAVLSGIGYSCGGNIFVLSSYVTIENNLICKGTTYGGPGDGGGIYFSNSSGIIRNNHICDNWAWSSGAGLCLYKSNPIIIRNIISNNRSDNGAGIDCNNSSYPLIMNNIIDNNFATFRYGGGILVFSGSFAIIENNTMVNNKTGYNCCGRGGAIYVSSSSTARVFNNIIAFNRALTSGSGIYCSEGGTVELGFNNAFNNSYVGCEPDSNSISLEPLFVDFENNNYHLQDESPCVDAGNPKSIYDDVDGTRNDMGAYGGQVARGQMDCLLLLGDVNMDFEVTVGDALCAFQIYLNGGMPSPGECNNVCAMETADANCDGDVTSEDALIIFQAYMNDLEPPLECPTITDLALNKQNSDIELSLEQTTYLPEDEFTVALKIDNPKGLSAFSFNLGFPTDLLSFVKVSAANLTEDWQALAGRPNLDGVITIGGFNPQPIDANESGTLVTLTFKVKKNVDGAGELWLFNLRDDVARANTKSMVINPIVNNILKSEGQNIPKTYALQQNYPNPFNPETIIQFQLPVDSDIELAIYNALGQKIRSLLSTHKSAGYYIIQWNGKDVHGFSVPSGIYLYKLRADNFIQIKKMLLMR